MLPQNLSSGSKIIYIYFNHDKKDMNELINYEIYTFDDYSSVFNDFIYIYEHPMIIFHIKQFVTLKEFRLMKLKEIL